MSTPTTEAARALRETADTEPYGFYDAKRAEAEVQWDDSMNAWLVLSYRACKELERNDDKLFRHAYLDMDSDLYVEIEGGPRNLLFLPDEDHQPIHRLLLRMLNPNSVEEHREQLIRPLVHRLIDRFAARGTAELVSEFAERLPVRVIAALMDLPYLDDEWIEECKHNMDEIAVFLEAHTTTDEELSRRAITASNRLNEMLMPVIDERRNGEANDLISRLWREGPNALDGWDEIDMRANIRVLFFGGSDTTSHVLANSFYLLMTQPELVDEIRERGDDGVKRFVEEALRMFGAVHFRPRVANQDIELGGAQVSKDDHLLAVNLAANRDPSRYECPHQVRFDRQSPRDHLAFHSGPRTCVGAALARVELQEAIKAFTERLGDMRLDPDAPEKPSFQGFLMRSYRPLHAVFTPEAA